MELFEQIRREYDFAPGTIKGVALKNSGASSAVGVREALASAVPRDRKITIRPRPKLEPVIPFIDAILQGDKIAPGKQRHTAHRIWCRIGAEMPAVALSESTIREYVRERKIAWGLTYRETFIAESYAWGGEAQVDWYEAYADICGERQKAYVFCLRSMASGGAFHCAFPHASQQAFLEAHEKAFVYFGGVFATLRYDNLKSAVKKILRGHQLGGPYASSPSDPTGVSWRSFAPQERDTKRVAWKVRAATFAGTTWCPCRRPAVGKNSTISCSKLPER